MTKQTNAIERSEWERRFKQRIIDYVLSGESNHTAEEARTLAESELAGGTFEYLSESFEDDPEGSADEAMSYWEP